MNTVQLNPSPGHADPHLPDVAIQRFSVAFEYPVAFTRGAFTPGNLTLLELLRRREPWRRHRAAVVVDSGVAGHWPHLADTVRDYATFHSRHLELAVPPW